MTSFRTMGTEKVGLGAAPAVAFPRTVERPRFTEAAC